MGLDQTLLDAFPIGACILAPNGKPLRFNSLARKLWGGPPRLFEADREPVRVQSEALFDALCLSGQAETFEVEVENPDGRRWVCATTLIPFQDDRGTALGAVAAFEDATGRRREAEARQQRYSAFQTMVEAAPEWISLIDRDGVLVQTNAAGLALLEADSAGAQKGASIYDLIAPDDRERWKDFHARVCSGERLIWEFDLIGLKGTHRTVQSHAAPATLPSGEPAQLAVIRAHSGGRRHVRPVADHPRRRREDLTAAADADADWGKVRSFLPKSRPHP